VPITQVGTLPVSSLNIGLVAGVAALESEIVKLTADITKFQGAVTAQLAITASFPPDLVGHAAAFAGALSVASLGAALNPATWVTTAGDANVELVADLGIIDAQLAIVQPIAANFSAGVDTGELYGWTYAGSAAGFGAELRASTVGGFGGIGPTENISALIIATSAFASWESFSEGFETGTSADANLDGTRPSFDRLQSLGSLTGGRWNVGVAGLLNAVLAFFAELEGIKASLEAQINLTLGINLPDPTAIVDLGLAVDLDAALGNLVNVQADLTGVIAGLQARVDFLLGLIASIEAQLSASGLTLWSYTGPAGEIGAALEGELAGGLPGVSDGPGGPAYGVTIASKSPSAWADFGLIFKTS
jgi:hypothetical protein